MKMKMKKKMKKSIGNRHSCLLVCTDIRESNSQKCESMRNANAMRAISTRKLRTYSYGKGLLIDTCECVSVTLHSAHLYIYIIYIIYM